MPRPILIPALVIALALALFAQGDAPKGVPAYNKRPPTKADKLPPILPSEVLWGPNFQSPIQVRAYQMAPKLQAELHQMPCYCYCDRVGHKSLRTCYESTHAANCDACLKELYYIAQEKKKGKTTAQIRKGIIAGNWKDIDLNAAAATN
jgi:hypothetical protein